MARLLLSALVLALVAVAIQARNAQPLPQYLGKHFTPEKEQRLLAAQRTHGVHLLKLLKRSLGAKIVKIALPQAAKNAKAPPQKNQVHGIYGKHVFNLRKRSLAKQIAAAQKASQEAVKNQKQGQALKYHVHGIYGNNFPLKH